MSREAHRLYSKLARSSFHAKAEVSFRLLVHPREHTGSVMEDVAPDFKLDMSPSISPLRGVYERDQVMGWVEQFTDSWESLRIEPHEFIEAGGR